MKKRRIKKSIIKKGIITLAGLIAILIIHSVFKTGEYHKTNEYKLKKIGYNSEEINIIKKTSETNINYILEKDYNKNICEIIKEKYYIDKNFKEYIEYIEKTNETPKETISIINTNADKKEYTDTKSTNIEKKDIMLVNKYNYLEKNYEPDKIIDIPSRYAYSGKKAPEEILNKYIEMFNAAEKQEMKFVISSAYISYEEQEEIYEYYKTIKKENIEKYISLPGYSEDQTGLTFDILTLSTTQENFEKTDEFKWLNENAYKYGFILRYPKGKEKITKYDYQPWHYRYVGKDAAKIIHDEDITLEEFYAFYIANKQQ